MAEIHPDCCGYPTAAHADFAIAGKCVIGNGVVPQQAQVALSALTLLAGISEPLIAEATS